jgi:uncharacterized protein (DUF697 family)
MSPQENRGDYLIRQIDTKLKQDGQAAQNTKQLAKFSEIMAFASGRDRCLMYSGWVFAGISGAILPCFIFMLGPVFDSFGPDNDPAETRGMVRQITAIMGILAFGIAVTGFFQYALCIEAAASITAKIKKAYLKAIMNQECAWFDLINYNELTARLSKETLSI